MDDIIALRQIEEDITNLIHRELFPLYKYHVGTEDHPADPDEVDQAAAELERFRTEGGLVLPERHDVDVIGSEGSALDISPYLAHFVSRVCVGLGLSPQQLGLGLGDANRSVTERMDIALYDKVKTYQRYLSAAIQMSIFNEILLEGGYDPYLVPDIETTSDRCNFEFNEIDVDTQVKKENHIIQKWTSDILMQSETRLDLGLRPEVEEDELYTAQSNRMLPAPGKPVLGGSAPGAISKDDVKNAQAPAAPPGAASGGAANAPKKPDAVRPSAGGVPNRPNGVKKAVSNKSKPANQFGRSMSPNITHSEEWLDEVVALLQEDE